MSALPLKAAAAELGISVSKLRRLSADGTGVVHKGGRGRARATLYDTHAIAETHPRQVGATRTRRSAEVSAQLLRGQRATTVVDAIRNEFLMLADSDALDAFKVPKEQQKQLVTYFVLRAIWRVTDHLKL